MYLHSFVSLCLRGEYYICTCFALTERSEPAFAYPLSENAIHPFTTKAQRHEGKSHRPQSVHFGLWMQEKLNSYLKSFLNPVGFP